MKTKDTVAILILLVGLVLLNSGCGKIAPGVTLTGSPGSAVFPTNLQFQQPAALK